MIVVKMWQSGNLKDTISSQKQIVYSKGDVIYALFIVFLKKVFFLVSICQTNQVFVVVVVVFFFVFWGFFTVTVLGTVVPMAYISHFMVSTFLCNNHNVELSL